MVARVEREPGGGEPDSSDAHRDIDAAVAAWIAAKLGPVHRVERQARSRPAWYVDIEVNDETQHFYVRGERSGMGTMVPLAQEAAILQVLEAHGIPVPHVYGMIDDPTAIVMDCLPGRANLDTVEDDDERRAILDHYVEILTRIHAIDPAAFECATLTVPSGPEALALNTFDRFETNYRAAKRRPDPLVEFAITWVRRNVPTHRYEPRFVTSDAAQFMFHEGRVSGILDLELASIGDVSQDLGNFRVRDMSEPLGDVGAALLRYEALTGTPLDRSLIAFSTVAWIVCTPMSLSAVVHAAPPMPELMQYLEWYSQYSLTTIEAIAEVIGVDLGDVELPQPRRHRNAGLHKALEQNIRGLAAPDPIDEFRRDATASIAQFLRMIDAHGASVEAANLDDIAALVGQRPADWHAGDTALEEFVLAVGPEHDAELVRVFHQRAMRQLRLMEPVLSTGAIKHLTPLAQLLGRN